MPLPDIKVSNDYRFILTWPNGDLDVEGIGDTLPEALRDMADQLEELGINGELT